MTDPLDRGADADPPAHTSYEAVARAMIGLYDLGDSPTLHELNVSENATYVVGSQGVDSKTVLRVHRTDYHDAASITSELAWLDALRIEAGISTPRAIAARNGDRVVRLVHEGVERYGVLFERLPGREPDELDLRSESFTELGALTARLHEHARAWRRPSGFKRFRWGWDDTLGRNPRWGRWQDDPHIGPGEAELLLRTARLVRSQLAGFGTQADRWGLVHADLRLANLLVDGDRVSVIDFDDCGFSWYLYDFASAVTFLEDNPNLPDLQEAWLTGYRSIVDVDEEHVALLPTFVMFRRLLVLAWLGSHVHSREARELSTTYRPATYGLAERYLTSAARSVT